MPVDPRPVPRRPLVPTPPQPDGVAWPTEDWTVADPAGVGADTSRLEDLLDELVDGTFHPRTGLTFAAAVVAGGRLVAERYGMRPYQDLRGMADPPELEPVTAETELLSWSMAKTITNLAVGVAVADGAITVDQPALDPRWTTTPDDPRAAITWADLLTMRPGLQWFEEYYELGGDQLPDVITMLYGDGAHDMAGFAAGFPLVARPGSPEAYVYSSGTSNILAAGVQRVLGLDQEGMDRFLHQRIFDPIGMAARPSFDGVGTYVGSSYTHATLRDWCRFGLLLLRGGRWDGRTIVPDGWIDWSRTARSWDDTVIHGAHLWAWDLDETPFGAHGFEGQRVIAFPARDVVVVRLGRMGAEDGPALNDHLAQIARCFPDRRTA